MSESGFREGGGFGLSSVGDGERTVKLSRVIYFQAVIWTLGRVELEVCECSCFHIALMLFFMCFLFSSHHNKIRSIDGRRTGELASVETLDLSNNDIAELRGHCFPAGLQIRHL